MNRNLDYYLKKFSKLHTDSGAGKYPYLTLHKAPHKPILLLSIIDLFEQKIIQANLIELNPDLGEQFKSYWTIVMPPDRKGYLVYPFYHLRFDGFWHLIAHAGKESILKELSAFRSYNKLAGIVYGAAVDDELFILLSHSASRNILRTVLIETYFDESVREELYSQSRINIEAYDYSRHLLKSVMQEIKEDEPYKSRVRDQGFRKAVVKAYDHRCSLCGIRMRTPDGHTVVDGAHIIPWSISNDDNIRNGISLCRLCHWTFDEGLISISNDYKLISSPRLNMDYNIAGHLITLERRDIIKPDDKCFWPAASSLEYHRRTIFRK